MTRLTSLRARLADLRRRRQTARWGTGYAALALAILWALVAAFLIDWCFELSKPARLLSLAISAAAVVWVARRFTLPYLGHHETDLDMALMVERQQKIDSDLVAALQFETPQAARWGSTQLEHAVIDYVAEFGKGWNVFEGFTRQELVRRAAALSATVALLGLAVAIFPSHSAAFINRFFLGSAHYPTRTTIEQILVNGKPVSPRPGGDHVVKTAYGRAAEVRGARIRRATAGGPRRIANGRQRSSNYARLGADRVRRRGRGTGQFSRAVAETGRFVVLPDLFGRCLDRSDRVAGNPAPRGATAVTAHRRRRTPKAPTTSTKQRPVRGRSR